MTNQEYELAINSLVSTGRGWDAIKDIARLLEEESVEQEVAAGELKAEKRIIKKFCNSKQTPKQKLDAIKSLIE